MSRENQPDLEVAIVGLACRFPGAASAEAFWRNLRDGVESIRDLTDGELRAAGVDEATLKDPRFVRRAADLRDADLFDAALFGFTPREAGLMDPQFRVFLEDAWSALEDAGHLSERPDLRVGVFAGSSPNTYLLNNVYQNPRAAESVGGFQTSIGNERDYLATHVSYRLGLRGPSLVILTACSTSLVAVHVACQSLLNHECDVAIAGGVSIGVPQSSGYLYEEGGIASPDGRCRAFDEAAAGCVKGSGCGVVVLRRSGDALRDGDAVRAVIVGSAVNNDGNLKVGFTAPGEEGQSGVIAEALSAAGVDPGTITYVETHGTATALGDPVEVSALARAFGANGGGRGRCAIGSVKTNVGHLDAAAGVAGLIKTVLALEHREIPPSLHFRRPNPKIQFAGTPFYVNAELRPWESEGSPRRAGVSSFGIGGTNAHVILEEPPDQERSSRARPSQLLVLSAASDPALAALSRSIADRIESDPDLNLADAAFTLQVGRKRLPWRRAVVARDATEAIASLRRESARRDERGHAEIAFLFPGQGSQQAGMARALHRSEPLFRETFDRCAETLRPLLGLDLGDVVFPESRDAQAAEERLRETSLAQPALFSVEYALSRLWISWGVKPSAMAGHSIGEYVASCLAGVMSLDEALLLVAERGRLMGGMPRGAMLAAQLSEADLAARLRSHPALSLAAINAPSSCVASGPEEAIARLEAELGASGIGCRRLRTSHAFHSAMMDPIVGAFEEKVRRTRLAPPSIPFLSNVTGTWITAGQATDPAYWAGHLRRAVRFADNLAALLADPSRVLLEAGPGTVLSSLAREQGGTETTIVASLRHAAKTGDDDVAMTDALGRLWCAGVPIDWTSFHEGYGRRRIPLPTYPFERRRFWIDPAPEAAGRDAAGASSKNPDLADWFYVPGWRRSFAREETAAPEPAWLVFDDGSKLARAVAELAAARGARVATVRAGRIYARGEDDAFEIDPRRRDHYDELLRDLSAGGALPARVVHLWCAGGARLDPKSALDLGFFSLLHLSQAMGQIGGAGDLRVVAVACGLFDVTGDAIASPERAALAGVCRVGSQEYQGATYRLVDVAGDDDGGSARRIAAEIDARDREPVVAWRGGHRWVPSYERVRLEKPAAEPAAIRPSGAYLLTGGTGPIEIAVARRLAESGAAGIAFVGCDGSSEAAAADLRASGIDVLCFDARLTDPSALGSAVAAARLKFGRLDAAFHTAGTIGGGMIQLKEREAAERVIAPRLGGALALAGLLRENETLVLFSSAISATGVFGQVDFCAASAALDALAESRRLGLGPRVVAIDWGTAHWDRWEGASAPGSEALLDQLREIQRSIGITIEEGVEALWRALALDVPRVVVSTQDLDALVAEAGSASVAEFLEGIGGGAARASARDGREIVPLASDTERRVASVWSDLLGIEPIGRTDGFFDLGGNSLLAIQLASHLRKVFDIDLTITSLFESADLKSLAAAVDAALGERREAEEVTRLLSEIEGLSDDQIRSELARSAHGRAGEATA